MEADKLSIGEWEEYKTWNTGHYYYEYRKDFSINSSDYYIDIQSISNNE